MFPPVIRSRSLRLSGMACARTLTSPASGAGTGTVSSRSTSTGAPYSCVRHARMVAGAGSMVFTSGSSGRLFGREVEVVDVLAELRPDAFGHHHELMGRIPVDSVLARRVVGNEGLHWLRRTFAHGDIEGVVDGDDRGELVA